MPYFHAVALFEGRGSSLEETDRAVASLLTSVAHRRLRYFEHETVPGAAGLAGSLPHFTVFADFDVEAYTEEKAADLVDEVLDAVSTDDLQYFSHGLVSGEQRVRPSRRATEGEEREADGEQRVRRSQRAAEDDEQEADGALRSGRGGRRRGTRGRGRGSAAEVPAVSPAAPPDPPDPPADDTDDQDSAPSPVATVDDISLDEIPVDAPPEEISVEPEVPPSPPSRSSASMQVKTAVTLRASELELPANGDAAPNPDELIALATTEARRRHPDLPGDTAPESDVASLPWGETVLTLTWSYDVPVPSARDSD